jgi:hypothetical protein
MPVEHAVEPPGLFLIALDGVGDLRRRVAEEHIGLSLHGPDAAHLEHQPLQHPRARQRLARQQLARLLRQVDEDGTRLEHGEISCGAIDDDRDATVRIESQEPRLLLLHVFQADRLHRVRQTDLLECDGDLPTVGGGCGVEIDHALLQAA